MGLEGVPSRDSAGLGSCPGTPKSSEGHNGASKVSIGIYSTSKCRESGCSLDLEAGRGRYKAGKVSGHSRKLPAAKALGDQVVFQN